MSLQALTPREASIFACLTDTVVAPEPILPAVHQTDAVTFFDDWLMRSPRPNRLALRAVLYAAELAPRLIGFRARLRRLPAVERGRFLDALDRAVPRQLRPLVKALKGIACLSYYGDDAVMRRLGYDAEANLRRARDLRLAESRP